MRFAVTTLAASALFTWSIAAPASAAVLLPGDILVSGREGIVLIHPGLREPQVVASPAVGSGEPFRTIHDFSLGADGFLYAVTLQQTVLRIDPATGDRVVLSSNNVGQGDRLWVLSAIEVTRAGTIYIADNRPSGSSKIFRIYSVDPTTGDRTLHVEATQGQNAGITDLGELPDGRLAVAVGVDWFDDNHVWIANPGLGTWSASSALFQGAVHAIAVASAGLRAFIVHDDFSQPVRILEAQIRSHPLLAAPPRAITSCRDAQPAFSLRPLGLALDASGLLIVVASHPAENCTVEGLRRLAGQVYRVDPVTGASTLLYESEPVLDSAAFTDVVVVPADFPFDDADSDRFADVVDNCPSVFNESQDDRDGDGVGDACNDEEDPDGDEIADPFDLCPDQPDPLQLDQDGDNIGDVCDPFAADPNNAAAGLAVELAEVRADLAMCLDQVPGDADGDGRADPEDLCPETEPGLEVDGDGCSLAQFCEGIPLQSSPRRVRGCALADWRNDEPVAPRDCRADLGRCIPR